MLFERTMELERFLSMRQNKMTAFISGNRKVTVQVESVLKPDRFIELKHSEVYTSWSSTSADIVDRIKVNCDGNCMEEINSSYELEEYLDSLLFDGMDIFIDISSMGVRLLSIVLANIFFLSKFKKNDLHVFCGYAEPKAYMRHGIVPDKGQHKQSHFDLYSAFAPLGPLPDFVSIGSDEKPQLWVVLLGFEGYRTKTIVDDISRIDDIIALVTIPSLKLGWSNHAISENSHFLRGVDHKMPSLRYATASSPFAVYNFLCELQNNYKEYRLQISPFSTKANSLGVLLYALHNPECLIVFDNPLESSRPAGERSNIYHVYEITEALDRAHIG